MNTALGELLAMAASVRHNDKGHNDLKHCAGLNYNVWTSNVYEIDQVLYFLSDIVKGNGIWAFYSHL